MPAHTIATASAIVAGQGFLLLATLLSIGHGRPLAHRLLAALIGVIALRMSIFHLLGLGVSHPTVLGALSQVFLLGGPLLYFYTRTLTDAAFQLRARHMLHALAPAASALATPYLYHAHSFGDGFELGPNIAAQRTHALHKLLAVGSFAGYTIAAIRVANRYQEHILDHHSSSESATLAWLRKILLLALLIATTLLAWNLHVLRSDSRQPLSALIEFCGHAMLFYLIATAGVRQHIQLGRPPTVAEEPAPQPVDEQPAPAPPDLDDKARYDRTSLSQQRARQLWDAVTDYMTRGEPYLNCDLSLADLSTAIGSYPRELSQVLNTVGGQNFYDFVNGYRALKARELIAGDDNSTAMIDIALAAGFTGRSTLYKHFSRCFAMTPSQFRKHQQRAGTGVELSVSSR